MDSNDMSTDLRRIKDNTRLIVGGNFTPDSLGPEIYDEILRHARLRAKEYIEEFEFLFLGRNFDALLQSNLYLPTLLRFLVDEQPELVRKTAGNLLKQYDSVLVVYDDAENKEALLKLLPEETQRLIRRLERRRATLKDILK